MEESRRRDVEEGRRGDVGENGRGLDKEKRGVDIDKREVLGGSWNVEGRRRVKKGVGGGIGRWEV